MREFPFEILHAVALIVSHAASVDDGPGASPRSLKSMVADEFDWTSVRSLLNEGERVAELVLDEIPALDGDAIAAISATNDWIGVLVANTDVPEPLRLACTQAANEFVDLLVDCIRCRGRPAIKAARSLFELLLTVLDISEDAEALERYGEHRWLVFDTASQLASGTATSKSAAHRQKKFERWLRPEVERVLRRFGEGFRRGWRKDTLADAAVRHGRQPDYEFYRLASAVLHGSSGGVLGQYLLEGAKGEEVATHRIGLNLSLCPDAYMRGISAFEGVVSATSGIAGGAAASLQEILQRLQQRAEQYSDLMEQLDREWWRTVERARLFAIATVDERGHTRWFLYDTRRNQLRAAVPPEQVPAPIQGVLNDLTGARRSGRTIDGVRDDEVITVNAMGVYLVPKQNSDWFHAAHLFQQRPLGADPGNWIATVEGPLPGRG